MNFWTQSEKNIFVAGHRGFSQNYPENSLISFEKAIELGVDQIEFDVHASSDGELVVFHDQSIERVTGEKGNINDMTLKQIKRLDIGRLKDERFKNTRVPTLIEFMELVKNHPTLTLDVELKDYPVQELGEEQAYKTCDKILQIIDQYNFTDRVVINSFSNPLNEYVYKTYGKKYKQHVFYPIEYLTGPITISPYEYAFCACMFDSQNKKLTKQDFDDMLKMGVEPWVGASVKDQPTVERAIENGARLITCNNPDVVLSILREKGYHK